MMRFKQLTIVILFALPLSGCFDSSTTLIDEYRIYPQDEFGNGYYLMCKLGCKGDPKIQNIASIEWNDRFIVIKNKDSQKLCYIIKAKGEKLKCCNEDILIGPLSEQELKKYLESQYVGKLNKKDF